MHSMIGLAAVFIAVAAVVEPWAFGITAKDGPIPGGNRIELALGAFIGAITFTGSVIASLQALWGKYKFRLFQGAPVTFKGPACGQRNTRPCGVVFHLRLLAFAVVHWTSR